MITDTEIKIQKNSLDRLTRGNFKAYVPNSLFVGLRYANPTYKTYSPLL